MNASVAKKTQDTLGKVIKKPPLTEKLLSKPPFRYLHDIFSEVIRTTSFMKGLYVEADMKSDNIKDKDQKIVFLQKAVDVVTLVSGEVLSVKPARIVAGHEAEKTNELLQAIGRCCLNKLSSEDAVKRVLAGDKPDPKGKPTTSKSQDKENREEKKEIKEPGGSRDRKTSDPKREEGKRTEKDRHREGERSDKGRERERTKDRDKEKEKEKEKEKSRDREKEKSRDREKEKEKSRDREKEKEKSRDREKEKSREKDRDKAKERDPHRDRERDRVRDRDREKERDKGKEPEERAKVADKVEKKTRGPEETRNRQPPEKPVKTKKTEPEEPADVPESQSESPARIPRPSSAKGQRRRAKPGGQDETDSEGEVDGPFVEKPAQLENDDVVDPLPPHATQSSSSGRRTSRPSSARPAPPRVKRQESYPEVSPAERLGSAKPSAALIVEGKKLSEDEDEQFVVDAAPPPLVLPEVEPALDLQGDEKHGGLVKKILETKREYETVSSSAKSKDQERMLVSELAQRKERDLVLRDIDRLRLSVQTVCRSTLPLGKIMDYIQEDMDSMQKELQTWRSENQEHAQSLLQEQRETESAVEPLKTELVELDLLIVEQQDKICAVKSSILKNEEKIQKMLSSINFSSRT